MTTTVSITHKGPDHHNVQVDVLGKDPDVPLRTHVLKSGETIELYVYYAQSLRVSETYK